MTTLGQRPVRTHEPLPDELRTRAGARRVPKQRYLLPEVMQAEYRDLWPKVWQWACLADELVKPGAYKTYEIGDQSILLTRSADGVIHAFHNVCLHRGNRLRQGGGTTRSITCPYHHWSWNHDGSLREIPELETFGDLDTSCLSLRRVAVDVWEGLVFVNLDPEAESLQSYLYPVTERLAPYMFGRQTCTRSMTMPIPANWKTIVDGFLDVYHLQGVHPQLLKILDDIGTTYELFGRHSAMYMPMGVPSQRLGVTDDKVTLDELAAEGSGHHGKLLRKSPHFSEENGVPRLADGVTVRQALIEVGHLEAQEYGRDYSGLTDDQLVDDHHYFLFPNTIMNIDAGHFIASRIRPHATDPEWCYFDLHVFDWLTDEQRAARKPRKHRDLEYSTEVGRVPDQDFTALPTVQLGLHSDGLQDLIFSDWECRIVAFHDRLDDYLFQQ